MSKVRLGAVNIDDGVAQAKFVEYDREILLSSVSIFGMPPFGTCTVNVQTVNPLITQGEAAMDSRLLTDPPGITGRLLNVGQMLRASEHPPNAPPLEIRANAPDLYYGCFQRCLCAPPL